MTPSRTVEILRADAFFAAAEARFAKQALFQIALAVDDGEPMPVIAALLRDLVSQIDTGGG